MQIFFDHILCHQSDKDLIFTLVSAYFDKDEENYALANGWMPFNSWYDHNSNFVNLSSISQKNIWVQVRSTRINVTKFKPSKKHLKILKNNIESKILKSSDIDKKEAYNIYEKYCNHRGFVDIKQYADFVDSCFDKELEYICYYQNGTLIGYCIVQFIANQMLSHQFCWDYQTPSLSLGTFSQIKEIEIAKSLNKEHVYIGAIAEKHGIYKTKFTGFEFWTGRKWESDTENLVKLLNKESEIKTIQQLSDLISDYVKLFNI